MNNVREILKNRLVQVQKKIEEACRPIGRSADSVHLLVVTKSVDSPIVRELFELGLRDFGENRPQELSRKAKALSDLPIRWHMIGNLQRNKIDMVLDVGPEIIHSVDRIKLVHALEDSLAKRQKCQKIFLEVNASGESNKHGFSPNELLQFSSELMNYPHLQICGLMTMAAYSEDPTECLPTFRLLAQLRDKLQQQRDSLNPQNRPTHTISELSMGMSNDYEIAIMAGATWIRLGTVLLEGLSV